MGSVFATSEIMETKIVESAEAAAFDSVSGEPIMMQRACSDMSEDPILPVVFGRQVSRRLVSDAYE